MSKDYSQTISDLQSELAEREQKIISIKQTINMLCQVSGKPPMYKDSELVVGVSAAVTVTRSDQFYGKPLATVVREVLEMRNAANVGPATVREIYETLVKGGYNFETKSEQNAMRGLRVSLTKNAVTFHKIPGGQFGLTEWYPSVKAIKSASNAKTANKSNGDAVDDGSHQEEPE